MDYQAQDEAGRSERVEVLKDFDLDVREGEFLSILGPSGCGKSTFLNILAGLANKTGGSLSIDGKALQGINKNQGVVFQGYALLPWRTVLDNIAVGLEIRGVGKAEIAERVGYSSASTFSVAFTRFVGLPPTHFARAETGNA